MSVVVVSASSASIMHFTHSPLHTYIFCFYIVQDDSELGLGSRLLKVSTATRLALHIQHSALYDVDDLYCYASSSASEALHASTNTLLCINRFIVYSVHTSGTMT